MKTVNDTFIADACQTIFDLREAVRQLSDQVGPDASNKYSELINKSWKVFNNGKEVEKLYSELFEESCVCVSDNPTELNNYYCKNSNLNPS